MGFASPSRQHLTFCHPRLQYNYGLRGGGVNHGNQIVLGFVLLVFVAGCGSGGGGIPAVPVMSVSQTSVNLSATFGGANPAPAMVDVTSSGPLAFTATSDQSWLMVTPASGNAPQSLQITAVLGTLISASYIGHITITAAGAQGSPATITVTFVVAAPPPSNTPFWSQWGANAQHTGMVSVAGQNLANKLVDIVYDPFVPQEKAENAPVFGEAELTVHYQAPIIEGQDVYMVKKSGTYNPCNPAGNWVNGAACGPNTWDSMVWNESRYTWENGQLIHVWDFASDWKPETNNGGLSGWEPVFHPADTANFLYVPGAGGTIWKVNKTDGTSALHINPFSAMPAVVAANTYVAGPLTSDSLGNVYYNVIQLNPNGGNPWRQNDAAGAWLVKVAPNDAATTISYTSLLGGNAPAGTDTTCPGTFFDTDPGGAALPWPPPSFPSPPTTICGSQRPGVNIAPAVAMDGTIYTASRAHFNQQQAYLVAVKPDLSAAKWVASLQNLLNDGCGVLLPIAPPGVTAMPNSCRNGTTGGGDPTTNAMGSGRISDLSSSSPTVLPDGSVIFGVVDGYNYARGHLFHFDSQGKFIGTFGFGWDSTPGVYPHGGTFSVVIKDNHYDAPAYCSFASPVCSPLPEGPYYITQIAADLTTVEWQFQSTTKDATHNNGFEWCINMPGIDMNGNVYVNSEDGNIYALPQGKSGVFTTPAGKMFLNQALGAAYTPLSIGPDGKLYTQNNGHLLVVGN